MSNFNRLALFLSTLFLAFAANISAQSTPSVSASENALLWEISGKDLTTPSYLYGTIHVIPKSDYFLSDAAKKALEESQRVTFEINMKEMNNPMALFGIMSKVFMADGKRLKDYVTAEDYAIVKHRFDSLGLPLNMLERMKPMFLSVLADGSGGGMSLEDDPSSKTTSYEMEFMRMAEKQKKDFAGLETLEFQMSIFDSIPYKVQADMLVKTIKSAEGGQSEFKKMVEMYKKQDIQSMSQMISEENQAGELTQYENMLLVNRNRNWIPIMSKMMKEKKTFFAVGAGHLGGERGVINLLRQEGYTLKPML